jgi:hypothetical protein
VERAYKARVFRWGPLMLFLLFPAVATGETVSGAVLLSWCSGTDKSACSGYLLGVSETVTLKEFASCRENATPDQVVTAGHKFLLSNPSVLRMPAMLLAADAMRRSFPCRKK